MKQSRTKKPCPFCGRYPEHKIDEFTVDTNFSVTVNRIIVMLAAFQNRNRRRLTNGTREHRTTAGQHARQGTSWDTATCRTRIAQRCKAYDYEPSALLLGIAGKRYWICKIGFHCTLATLSPGSAMVITVVVALLTTYLWADISTEIDEHHQHIVASSEDTAISVSPIRFISTDSIASGVMHPWYGKQFRHSHESGSR